MIDAARAYEIQSGRLGALTGFLASFAPAIGERPGDGYDTIDDFATPGPIMAARNAAVVAAFRAVESIARNS